MSRPRLLADHDLKDAMIRGVQRREPSIEFVRARDLGLETQTDADILEFAARGGWIVVTHDVNTMTAAASERLTAGDEMSGLLLTHQRDPMGDVIDSLVLIWQSSEAEEWVGQIAYLPL
jgi:predicted nuclease of predicted toxin-antitoxin system